MQVNKTYTEQELSTGIKYLMSVVEWVKIAYGEQAAEEWIKNGFSNTQYLVDYNAAYEAFFTKIMKLRKDQKEAMQEMLLSKVYLRAKQAEVYNRLERRLAEIEK